MSIINAGSPLPHDGWYKIVHLEGEAPQTVFLKDGGTASWRKKKKTFHVKVSLNTEAGGL